MAQSTTRHILVHYKELILKGKNRKNFETVLVKNLRHRLGLLGCKWPVRRNFGRLIIDLPGDAAEEPEEALEMLTATAGVVWVAPARRFDPSACLVSSPDLSFIEDEILRRARKTYRPNATFSVRVTRGDKRFAMTSEELERHFGALIIRETEWDSVNIRNPDQAFRVGIYTDGIYVYHRRHGGIGGLPLGTGGRVLTLLSGGIDSPVAAFLAAKRGCQVDFLHFTAGLTDRTHAEESKVAALVRLVSRYTGRSRVFFVPSIHFDAALLGQPIDQELNLFRRFMVATAERLALRNRARALVTGDNLGQVASQTLDNIAATARAAKRLPILQPLITYEKEEIVRTAREIGTYDLSIQPYKDCCALISGRPQVASRHEELAEIESKYLPDYGELIRSTLSEAVSVEFDCGRVVGERRETGISSG